MRKPSDAPNLRETTDSAGAQKAEPRRSSIGNWTAIAVLLLFLGMATAFAVYVWNQLGGVEISTQGWVAMSLGILFTAAIGVGLMTLIFYSSRRNYDQ